MNIDKTLTPQDLRPALARFWPVSGTKIERIEAEYDAAAGSPVFTVAGRYTTRRAGRSGRRGSSTARPSCSSMRRATSGSWRSAGRTQFGAWRRT